MAHARAPACHRPVMASAGQKLHRGGDQAAIERRIGQIAGRQQRLITHRQLVEVGLTPRMIGRRSDGGRLHRLQNGVYAIHSPPHPIRQRWMAAALACGSGARLCGSSAGALQEIAEVPAATIHVCSPTRTGRSRPGITVHHRIVDPRDARRVDGIPCVSADLVLIDLAQQLDEAELEVALVAAESKGLLKRHRLGQLVVEGAGRPGIHKLAALLALEPAITRSDLEPLMLPIARLADVERPLVNHPVRVPGEARPLVVDFAWPKLRMVVELDSQRFHGDWERAVRDRERDQLLAIAGWRCHRFIRGRLIEDRDGSVERLRLLAAARAAELAGGGKPATRRAG